MKEKPQIVPYLYLQNKIQLIEKQYIEIVNTFDINK